MRLLRQPRAVCRYRVKRKVCKISWQKCVQCRRSRSADNSKTTEQMCSGIGSEGAHWAAGGTPLPFKFYSILYFNLKQQQVKKLRASLYSPGIIRETLYYIGVQLCFQSTFPIKKRFMLSLIFPSGRTAKCLLQSGHKHTRFSF
jgi:hypothetical protein